MIILKFYSIGTSENNVFPSNTEVSKHVYCEKKQKEFMV